MGFSTPYFHADCNHLLTLEQEADSPEMSFWYCEYCDVYTNDIKAPSKRES